MKASALKYTVLTWISGFTILIFVLVPFHAFITVWGSTLVGHYAALRLWKEALLCLCVIGVLYLLATDRKIRSHTLSRRLVWLILGYIALNIIWGVLALNQHDVTAKALGYGLIVNLRFLIFFLVTWAVTLRMKRLRSNWIKFILWPAIIVVIFGITQELLLTPRFLEHFGYSKYTILPVQLVDNQPSLNRIQSTLRGANPLGAYLVVVISIAIGLLFKERITQRKRYLWIFIVASLIALFFTYSRSAWVGMLISAGTLVFIGAKAEVRKQSFAIGAAGLLILGVLAVGFWQNSNVQNALLHTSENAKPHVTSNEARSSALKSGLSDLADHPLGDGTGTAGPASVYNNKPPRIAENYFVQIGQELGWLGLGIFVLINVGVGYLLWLRRADPLALSLFAALIGITFINLLSHAWTDDTLAYIWWGLAGIAMVADQRIKTDEEHK